MDIYKKYTTEELVGMYQSSHNEVYLQEIIKRNNGLLHKWVLDYANIPFCDMDDLLEEGYIALWRAVEHFDLNRGYTFSSCLKGHIKQRFNRLYKEFTRKKRYIGSDLVSYEKLEEINREGSIEFDFFSNLAVQEFINSLEEKAQYIVMHLLEGYSKGDIARLLDITPASLTYHIKRLQQAYLAYR